MSPDTIVVAALAVLALGVAVSGRASLDLVGLGLILALVLSGVLELDEALAGFSNHAVITLAGLYVLGEGLAYTGALQFVARHLTDLAGDRPWRVILALCVLAALISGVASNTAVALAFIPLAVELGRRLGIRVTHILMPVAFASILGGTLTLVGSTTNLLASGAGEAFGSEPLNLFSMTPVALALCCLCIPLAIILPRRLLQAHSTLTESLSGAPLREFITEMNVGADSPLIGNPLEEGLTSQGLRPLMVVRKGDVHWPPFEEGKQHDPMLASQEDSVMLAGRVDHLMDVQDELGLEFLGDSRFNPRTMELFELVISPSSSLLGKRLGDLNLWRDLEVLVVAILRGGHHLRERASELRLKPGDVLLVSGPPESAAKIRRSLDFYRLAGEATEVRPPGMARRALWISAAVILAFLLGTVPGLGAFLPVPLVALAGAVAMVGCRCIDARRAYRCIGWPILIFVVGALALGKAMEKTGLCAEMAHGVLAVFDGYGPAGTLAGILLAGTLLNQIVSPYAVSVLLAPVALSTAATIGAPAEPFLMAVAFAGSNAFATPLGHQVNLLILEPGGYTYMDFLKVGLPLTLVYWLVAAVGLSFYL